MEQIHAGWFSFKWTIAGLAAPQMHRKTKGWPIDRRGGALTEAPTILSHREPHRDV